MSYEVVNNLFSYHLPADFQLYAGGGYIFHKELSGLDPWSTQAGLGFRSQEAPAIEEMEKAVGWVTDCINSGKKILVH